MQTTFGAFKCHHAGNGIYWRGSYNVEGVGTFATLKEAQAYSEEVNRLCAEREAHERAELVAGGNVITARAESDGSVTFTIPGHGERKAPNKRRAGAMVFDLCEEFGMDVIWL